MPYQTAGTEPRHVVVVDDDAAVRDILCSCLERECYGVSEASGGPELFAVMDKAPVHLITLDLGLAGEDGLAIARQIRSRSSVPIIMATGKGDPIDRVVGLEVGADDYIAKPFHVREVLARVRSVLRRAEDRPGNPMSDQAPDEQLAFAGLVLNCVRRDFRSPNGAIGPLTKNRVQPARGVRPSPQSRPLARPVHGSGHGAGLERQRSRD